MNASKQEVNLHQLGNYDVKIGNHDVKMYLSSRTKCAVFHEMLLKYIEVLYFSKISRTCSYFSSYIRSIDSG